MALNFDSDSHALTVGMILGAMLARMVEAGYQVGPIMDGSGANYTNQIFVINTRVPSKRWLVTVTEESWDADE